MPIQEVSLAKRLELLCYLQRQPRPIEQLPSLARQEIRIAHQSLNAAAAIAAIGIAFLVQLLRQPLIISYIITGIIAGPMVLNLVNSSWDFFNVFSEFGVILLLFLIGLSLNVNYLKKIGKVAAFTGVGQVADGLEGRMIALVLNIMR